MSVMHLICFVLAVNWLYRMHLLETRFCSRSCKRTTRPRSPPSRTLAVPCLEVLTLDCKRVPAVSYRNFADVYSSVPVPDNNTNGPFPAARFTVQDTNPVWVYCRQANHCQQGMVFAINPGDKFAAFQAAAMGQAVPASGSPPPATVAPVTVTATVTVSGTQLATTTYVSSPGSAAPTSAVSTDHKIVVGGPNKLFFDPANITAQPGDTITFQFMQKNHTATQSSFANPCTSLTQTSTSGQIGFDSGL